MSTSRMMLSTQSPRYKNLIPVLICLALAIITVISFWSLKDCGFINLDDDRYVYANAYLQSGLNWNTIKYAFSFQVSNWHPVTWLSLMLDHQMFGLNPAGYHLINLLFHVLNTILLFLILRRMTKTLWPCAFVAAVFAVHPLHVESVAWIAERKDVLSAFFWMLTMGAYSYYVEQPGFRRYFFVLLFFVLGLMAKPMLVTLPFVLLLLDYWPLRRFGDIKWPLIRPLLREKAPLFVLTILSCIVTYIAQQKGGAVTSFEMFSPVVRIGNAFIAYVAYMGKMIWPSHLAVLYPHPGSVALWQVLGAAFLLSAITVVVLLRAKRSPYLVTGWLWYLGTLAPVIGIVQVGIQAMADRYTYIPLTGLLIMVAWGVWDLVKNWRYRKEILFTASALIILCLSIITWTQVGYWLNSQTLYDHTLMVTDDNWLIYNNRGNTYNGAGDYRLAIEDYDRAITIKPGYADAYMNRGAAYNGLGHYKQSIEDFSRAIEIKPGYAEAYINRGATYNALGQHRQALDDLNRGIEIKPGYAEAYFSRGVAYAGLGHDRQAIEDYDRAIEIKPGYADAYVHKGLVYLKQGDNISGCRNVRKACDLGNCDLLQAVNNDGLCR